LRAPAVVFSPLPIVTFFVFGHGLITPWCFVGTKTRARDGSVPEKTHQLWLRIRTRRHVLQSPAARRIKRTPQANDNRRSKTLQVFIPATARGLSCWIDNF
jgi:hypothetical protein